MYELLCDGCLLAIILFYYSFTKTLWLNWFFEVLRWQKLRNVCDPSYEFEMENILCRNCSMIGIYMRSFSFIFLMKLLWLSWFFKVMRIIKLRNTNWAIVRIWDGQHMLQELYIMDIHLPSFFFYYFFTKKSLWLSWFLEMLRWLHLKIHMILSTNLRGTTHFALSLSLCTTSWQNKTVRIANGQKQWRRKMGGQHILYELLYNGYLLAIFLFLFFTKTLYCVGFLRC